MFFPVALFLGLTCPAPALVSYWFIFIHNICILVMSINAILGLADQRAHPSVCRQNIPL